MVENTNPEYRMTFDPIRKIYIASNGIIGVPVRRTIGWAIIQAVDAELQHPLDDEGLSQVGALAAKRVFDYMEKFT